MARSRSFIIVAFLLGALAGAFGASGYLDRRSVENPTAASLAEGEDANDPRTASATTADMTATAAFAAGEAREPVETTHEKESAERLVPTTLDVQSGDERGAVQTLLVRAARLESELLRLRDRVAGLERRVASAPSGESGSEGDRPRARTPEDRRAALRDSGVSDDLASEIVWLQGQYELDRLELRDQALREGWFGTDRYRQELGDIGERRPDLRSELGEDIYDRFLFTSGENNRILVQSIIAGSAAEEAGLQPGDVIEAYDGERMFEFSDLRSATTDGERGELVGLQVRRADGSVVQSYVPRGPLGVRLDGTRVDPAGR